MWQKTLWSRQECLGHKWGRRVGDDKAYCSQAPDATLKQADEAKAASLSCHVVGWLNEELFVLSLSSR